MSVRLNGSAFTWLFGLLLASCGASSRPTTPTVAAPPPPAPTPTVVAAPPADPLDQTQPLDPDIKLGHLSNGLTYYVMKHAKPEVRASLWLAVNAGSVLEDDDQRGLAHFVEHMAFDGTKRFPKQDIINYIEKAGMTFGADLNAYTSFDQTVYMLTVPTDDHDVLMKGLDILRDWAGDVSFDPVELERERGVVLEEWRLGRGAFARLNDKQWPVLMQGSRYAQRLVIGKPEIIKGAPRDALVRFYKDWYRPDQMAVIAVGDFDAAQIETEIRARFGDLVNPAHERERAPVPVPHDQPTAVTIESDPEMPFSSVSVIDKMDHRPLATKRDYRRWLVEGLYHSMLGARFEELAQDPAAPFTDAGSSTHTSVRTSDWFTRNAQAKAGHVPEATAALLREIERVGKFGFLRSELERARARLLARAENAEKEWAKTPDRAICDEITRHFFEHEGMPGRAVELAYDRELLPTVTLDELNQLASSWGGEHGRVIRVMGPASEKLPDDATERAVVADAMHAPVEAWTDSGGDRPLMAHAPTPGKVVATKHDDSSDATVWTLANGVRVVVKPTTFNNDDVEVSGWQRGGSSLLSDADWDQVRFSGLVTAMGVGDFDAIALDKVLAGKKLDVQVSYDELSERVHATTRPADLETMLQLLHLRMTVPRKDERAFAAWKQRTAEWLQHKDLMPEMKFSEEAEAVETNHHHRRLPQTVADLDKVQLDRALAIYKDRFADLGHFTFVIVGNIDVATLQPLVETYLGSLPAGKRDEHWKDIGVKYPTHTIKTEVAVGTEPKSFVMLQMTAPTKWTRDDERDARALSKVLGIRLREVLRQDLGGVYFVNANANISREPKQRRWLSVFYSCDPANVDKLNAAVFAEVAKIQKAGIGDDYLAKVREQLRREHETDVKENRWWLRQLTEAFYYGEDFAAQTDAEAAIARVTSANVQAAAKRFFTADNYMLFVMKPKR